MIQIKPAAALPNMITDLDNVESVVLTKRGRYITAVDRGDIARRFLRQRQV